MENQGNKIVTLVLDNQRFKVNKRKLINKSQYFAALLSKNFKDHSLSEHKINYEIPVTSFKDFINWIHSDEMTERNVIINEIGNNVERLLILFDLSILFAVNDELTETIINILQNCDLTPQDALSVWPMAQEFSFNMLRDLSFSVCLDRFTELPINLICELSKENFLQLIENTNLRIPKTKDAKAYLSRIAQEWMKVNKDTILFDNLKKTGPKVYKSIMLYCIYNGCDYIDINLHCWDGDKSFEFATFKCPQKLINYQTPIDGITITARGHNIYFIGGNSGSKIFNTKVWRYSLITKKWHFETTMPCERRNMIAAFVQNKLLLAGGYGSNNQTLKSLDIYNVHKGTWTKGMDIPREHGLIDFFVCCNVVDKHLICFSYQDLKFIHIYNSEINYWCTVAKTDEQQLHLHDLHMPAPVIKQFKSASFDVDETGDQVNLKSIVCDNSEYKQEFYKKYAQYLEIEEKYKEENKFDMYFYFIKVLHDEMYDYYVLFCSKNENVEYKLIHLKRERLPWRSVPIQNLDTYNCDLFDICSTMISNVMDPADLYVNTI